MSDVKGFDLYPMKRAADDEALRVIVQAWMTVTLGGHPKGLELMSVVRDAALALLGNESLRTAATYDVKERAELAQASAAAFFDQIETLLRINSSRGMTAN